MTTADSQPPTYALLTFEECGAGIGAAATVLRANATSSGLQAPVPTCPGWTVTDLVAHQGMVHRWCADTLRGERHDAAEHLAEGLASTDLLQWFDDGATALLDVMSKTPDTWEGFFFLDTAPHPRDGWARRQCHETTIHAVDAMSARLGRPPRAEEVWFSSELATDGIDELVVGFGSRSRSPLRSREPVELEIRTTDTGAVWTAHVHAEDPPRVERRVARAPDARWSGRARDLYLGVWNRIEPSEPDRPDDRIQTEVVTPAGAGTRELWRELMQVRWS